jgi:hypothetical protein
MNIDQLLQRLQEREYNPFERDNQSELYKHITAAIERRAKLTRYCPACGFVGAVSQEVQECCPDGMRAVHLPAHLAEQAALGFQTQLRAAELSRCWPTACDSVIVDTVLPMLYKVLNDILETSGESIPRSRVLEARKLLPPQYSQSITKAKQ